MNWNRCNLKLLNVTENGTTAVLFKYLLFQLDLTWLCITLLVTNKWINNQSNSERWGLPAIPKYWIEKKVFYFFLSVHFNESFEKHWWILCIFHLQTVPAWLWQVLNVFSKNFSFHFFRTGAITWNKRSLNFILQISEIFQPTTLISGLEV